ncbi:MAG: glycine--tRNA ligase subunit alpha [Acidobacteriota bacterium]
MPPATIQELASRGTDLLAARDCTVLGPPRHDLVDPLFESQAYFRLLGPEPWSSVQVQRVLRPQLADLDSEHFPVASLRLSALFKEPDEPPQGLMLDLLRAMGFELEQRDVRFADQARRNAVLGLQGVGWRLLIDGVDSGWLSYFQRAASQVLEPVTLALSLDLERLALLQQRSLSLYDVDWAPGLSYGEARAAEEAELSKLFGGPAREDAEVEAHVDEVCRRAMELLDDGLILEAFVLAHEAVVGACRRGASLEEAAAAWQTRVGAVVDFCARRWLEERRRDGFPLSPDASRSGVIRRLGV